MNGVLILAMAWMAWQLNWNKVTCFPPPPLPPILWGILHLLILLPRIHLLLFLLRLRRNSSHCRLKMSNIAKRILYLPSSLVLFILPAPTDHRRHVLILFAHLLLLNLIPVKFLIISCILTPTLLLHHRPSRRHHPLIIYCR